MCNWAALSVMSSNPTRANSLCDPQIIILRLGVLCNPFRDVYEVPRDTGFIHQKNKSDGQVKEFFCELLS